MVCGDKREDEEARVRRGLHDCLAGAGWCEVFQPANLCVGMCCEFEHSTGHSRECSLIICNFATPNRSLIEVPSPIRAKSQLPNNIR